MHTNLIINHHLHEISALLYFFMIFGVIAASVSGAIRAIEAKMDITGAILLAFIAANGGGTVRDIILGTTPFWIRDQFYIWITLFCGGLTFSVVYFNSKVINSKKLRTILIITDAMGLAAFSLAGVEKSLSIGENNLIAIMMGVWTAIGGGVFADIIANRIPLIFSQELYLTVAFIGSICYLFLTVHLHFNHLVASMIAALIMVFMRLYSVKFNWHLPTIHQI